MKSFFVAVTAASCFGQILAAQDKAPAASQASPAETNPARPGDTPVDQRLDLMPSEKPRLLPAPASSDQVPLIPETPTPVTKPSGRAIPEPKQEKKSKTEVAADELQQRVRFREIKTRASKDPAVQADWDRAHVARTDFEKREALKSYYHHLYDRMRKMDGSLRKLIAEHQQRSLGRLAQTRIDPTEPLDPQERTERFGRD